MEFGLRKGLEFPEGFNSGQEVVMILDRVALPYSEVKDFNDLPIPFACVATILTEPCSDLTEYRHGLTGWELSKHVGGHGGPSS
jgi:hypothetical protein